MGGFGSGSWDRKVKKTTVERCLRLNIDELVRKRLLVPEVLGTLAWRPRSLRPIDRLLRPQETTPRPDRSASYIVKSDRYGNRVLILLYEWLPSIQEASEIVRLDVSLQFTKPHFGGLRWWMLCPLERDGNPCHRRVRNLYLPPRSRSFGCRMCHQLVYKSSQTAHQQDLRTWTDGMLRWLEKDRAKQADI